MPTMVYRLLTGSFLCGGSAFAFVFSDFGEKRMLCADVEFLIGWRMPRLWPCGLFNLLFRPMGKGGLVDNGGFLDVVMAELTHGFTFSSGPEPFSILELLRLLSTIVFNLRALFVLEDALFLTLSKSSTATYF